MGSGIHSVPCTVEQLVHLSVGQRRQGEGAVQMLHVQMSPVVVITCRSVGLSVFVFR